MTAVANRIRALPERYGKKTLIALGLIAIVGLGARAYVVANPVASPADDSHAYFALSKALYEEGSYGGPEFRDSSDWSPGAPLLYAASFYATGGAREGTARIVEALLGVAAILVVFALGRRLGEAVRGSRGSRGIDAERHPGAGIGSVAGLLAAFAVAVYPPFIHSTGELMSEPPAILTLPAAVLAFLWASERERLWVWLVPGLLFGLTAMFRPEYLFVGAAFVVLAAIRVGMARGWRPGLGGGGLLLAALLLPIVPWTIRNVDVLDRVVPISTGSGKALYVGTFLPADGEYQRVKAILVERYEGRRLDPHSRGPRRRRPGAAVRPRRRPLSGAAARLGARQDRQREPLQVLRRRPGRLPGDDRAQGRPDVEQRRRRSDEQQPRAGGADPASSPSAWPAPCCWGCAAAGGSWSRWRRRSSSSPPSAPPRWPPRAATRC